MEGLQQKRKEGRDLTQEESNKIEWFLSEIERIKHIADSSERERSITFLKDTEYAWAERAFDIPQNRIGGREEAISLRREALRRNRFQILMNQIDPGENRKK